MNRFNPVTTRRLPLAHPAKCVKASLLTYWFKRKGVPAELAWTTMREMGLTQPYRILGMGSFAVVVMDPANTDRIIKFTSDPADAQVSSELLAMYRDPEQAGNALEVASRIYGVFEVPYHNEKNGQNAKFYVIMAERVFPLITDPITDIEPLPALSNWDQPDWRSQRVLAQYLDNAFSETTRDVHHKVYRRTLLGKPIGGKLRGEMTMALDNLASSLEYRASRLHDPRNRMNIDVDWNVISNLLYNMGNRIRILIEAMDMPIIDLHSGNWGVRKNADGEIEPVIIDFGLSSGGAEPRNADREILEIVP